MGTTRITGERPYLQCSISELEALFEHPRVDENLLLELKAELEFRGKPRARRLLALVESSLQRGQPGAAPVPSASSPAAPAAPPAKAAITPSFPPYTPATPPYTPATAQAGNVIALDPEQEGVVEAARSARIILNAPPGTGKTTVACARIAWLLEEGVAESRIWLVSFTRTAVRELRNRITRMAEGNTQVHGVRVTTLDSRAWHLVQGFTGRGAATLAGGHDGTIADAISLIRSDDEHVRELLGEMAHIVIDEAQDLLGDRATLLEEIIRRVPRSCGVTVLTDDAQSIYGFTEDDFAQTGSGTLPERLRTWPSPGFSERELTKVYRARSENLVRLFIDGRRRLLSAIDEGSADPINLVRVSIDEASQGEAQPAHQDLPGDNALVLFRRRYEVLEASSYLGSKGHPHRIRMSGVPVALHPWLGLALSNPAGTNRLKRTALEERWPEVVRALGTSAPALDVAWADLHRAAGDGNVVLLDELRDVLSRSRPPIEFVTGELGMTGPILSTIHASKGREADEVRLFLPGRNGGTSAHPQDPEEARVLFVGATRARNTLTVGRGSSSRTGRLDPSGRCYHLVSAKGAQRYRSQVEVGLDNDVEQRSPVALATFANAADAAHSQAWLRDHVKSLVPLRAWIGPPSQDYVFGLRPGTTEAEPLLGRLSPRLNADLFKLAKFCWPRESLKPAQWIGPLTLLGVRSVVIPVDDPSESEVHSPWRESGFWLAPVVVGLPTIPFRDRATRK